MVGARRAPTVRTAAAFAPGHVTGIFSPDVSNRDPRGRGSLGAGLVLDAGVHARVRWNPSARRRLVVHADIGHALPISTEVARRLFAEREGQLDVVLRHELPIGQGFGMSAAGAVAVALSVGSVLGVPVQRCIETAHLADLFGRGGLGGVPAILGGGLEMRTRPGVPPWGRVRHRQVRARVLVGIAGRPVPSPSRLSDEGFLRRVEGSAIPRLKRMGAEPSMTRFLLESRAFARDLDFAPPTLNEFLDHLGSRGIRATQTMFGNAFVAWTASGSKRAELLAEVRRRRWPALEVDVSKVGASRIPVREKAF